MATEPSRRLFGGKTAVQSEFGAITGPARVSDARSIAARRPRAPTTRRALPLALGSVTIVIIAVAAATTLPGGARSEARAPVPLPQAYPAAYVPAAYAGRAAQAPASATPAVDPG